MSAAITNLNICRVFNQMCRPHHVLLCKQSICVPLGHLGENIETLDIWTIGTWGNCGVSVSFWDFFAISSCSLDIIDEVLYLLALRFLAS